MAVSLAPVAHQQFFGANGAPLAGGFIFSYSAGTTTPLATFTDSTGSTPNPNPIVLDSGGFANIWLSSNIAYKFVVQNSASVTQWTVDNIIGGIVGVGPQKQIFTSSGTFTIPVAVVKCTVIGAGGAGGGANSTTSGGGGGAGGAGIKWFTGLTPSNTLTVTIGVAGTGVSNASGNAGTGSSVASGTQIITTISAGGGAGGAVANGSGGTTVTAIGTGGDLNLGGSPGNPSITSTQGGEGGVSIMGGGGAGGGANTAGVAAVGYGSGGGGAGGSVGNNAGGAGAAGLVIFEWVA